MSGETLSVQLFLKENIALAFGSERWCQWSGAPAARPGTNGAPAAGPGTEFI